MSYYYKLGKLPPKRHIQFRKENGELFSEELVSSRGFSGIYSNLYHHFPPTQISKVGEIEKLDEELLEDRTLQPVHLNTSEYRITGEDFLDARKILMKNKDIAFGLSMPSQKGMSYFYKNGEADEILFIHDGKGTLKSQFGVLSFEEGDYVVIPRTTIYQIEFNTDKNRVLVIESTGPVETVKRYRNELGQLLEHSPYCERDIHPPQLLETHPEKGAFMVKVKKGGYLHHIEYESHPFDVAGWDGFLYPYTLSIKDFEPITGRIHQPPPVHQTFQAPNYVICSFVPRLFDYHPQSIPAPYNHSNIDSEEVLYYVEGNFMSRKGIDRGSFTLHPGGIPHGPHPGTAEASIGAKETHEYAVMIDTFKPLNLTKAAMEFLDDNYPLSWKTK